jgi:hypothetical protein
LLKNSLSTSRLHEDYYPSRTSRQKPYKNYWYDTFLGDIARIEKWQPPSRRSRNFAHSLQIEESPRRRYLIYFWEVFLIIWES